MNFTWLILDSVSYNATSFHQYGPETTPKLKELAERTGKIFSDCYCPGYASPGSHGSFFTGRYPSETGFHKANPRFDPDVGTIATELGPEYKKLIISNNLFLFNGLDEEFDKTIDMYRKINYPFPNARTPKDGGYNTNVKYLKSLTRTNKPLRSFINGLVYKLGGTGDLGDETIDQINKEIQNFFESHSNESKFVTANFMDAHPPFTPSNAAIEKFADDFNEDDLPIGKKLPFRSDATIETTYEPESMFALYRATIWDLDRKITTLIEDLIAEDTIVFVTADHGRAVYYDDPLADSRTHVPLLVFGSDYKGEYIEQTVNLRHLAATTVQLQDKDPNSVRGQDLLSLKEDQTSITEYIHHSREPDPPATANVRGTEQKAVYQARAVKGGTKIRYCDHMEKYEIENEGEYDANKIKNELENHVEKAIGGQKEDTKKRGMEEYNNFDKDRLRHLGYLEQ